MKLRAGGTFLEKSPPPYPSQKTFEYAGRAPRGYKSFWKEFEEHFFQKGLLNINDYAVCTFTLSQQLFAA